VAAVDHTDAEIIWGIGVAIAVSLVQPDPAVLTVQSYAAARGTRSGGAVPHDGVTFDQRVERGGHNSNPSRAVGRGGESLNSRVARTADDEDAMIPKTLYYAWAPHTDGVLPIRRDSELVG
jgi:hypothetical protein